MPLLRRDHDADQTQYEMREKTFSIGEDFWIENQAGERAFKIDGKALGLRDTLILQDPVRRRGVQGPEQGPARPETMEIERDGNPIATVEKALVYVVRDRFSVDVDGRQDLDAKGNIVELRHKVERDGDHVGEVAKRRFRVPDTYGAEIAPGQDDA